MTCARLYRSFIIYGLFEFTVFYIVQWPSLIFSLYIYFDAFDHISLARCFFNRDFNEYNCCRDQCEPMRFLLRI